MSSALALLIVSAASMPVWQWENPSHGGPFTAVHGVGSTLWAVGPRGSMVTSTDGGLTWSAIESGVTESLNAIDGGGSLVIALGSSHVLRSRDGATFEKKLLAPTHTLVDVAVTASTVFVVGNDGSLWRSKDGGDSYSALPKLKGGSPTSIAVAPSGLYVGTTDGMYRSTDEGATFSGVLTEPVQRIAVRGSTIYALAGSHVHYASVQICGSCVDARYEVVALYRSSDGKAWQRRVLEDPATTKRTWGAPVASPPPPVPPKGTWSGGYRGLQPPETSGAWGPRSLVIGPKGEIYATADALHVSTDGGATFTTRTTVGGAHWPTSTMLVSVGNGIASSRDHGATWKPITRAHDAIVTTMTAMPDGRLLALASDGALLVREKGWSKVALPIHKNQQLEDIVALDAHHVILVGRDGLLLRSTDGGRTFKHRASDSTEDLTSVWGSGDEVFAIGRKVLLHSRDRGATWSSTATSIIGRSRLWGTSPTDLWAVGDSGVMRSTDRGRTWREVDTPLAGMFNGIWKTGNELFLVGMKGQIRHSRDGGKTWKPRRSGTTAELHDVWGQGDTLFAVGGESYERGPVVLVSRDRGATWSEEVIHADLALYSITATKDTLFVVGTGGAILRRAL